MKIACFLQGETAPSSRFRVLQYVEHFADAGIKTTCFYPVTPKYGRVPRWLPGRPLRILVRRFVQLFVYLPHRWWQIHYAELRSYDVVIIQKQITAWPVGTYLEQMIARRNPRIVLDLDDAEFTNPAAPCAPKANDPILRLAGFARAVVVCNQYLFDLMVPAARKLVKLPTALDEFRFTPKKRGSNGKVTIGWTGSASTINYLRPILPALEIALQRADVSLLIISDQSHIDWLAHLPGIRFVKWNPVDEVTQLQEMDIGIMPLPDDPWTRGKCAFKIVQYMAIGIPSVASPVGMNCEVLADGETGYFASTTQEWIDRLESLILLSELRMKMGNAARARFEERLSGSKIAAEWISLLHDIGNSPK